MCVHDPYIAAIPIQVTPYTNKIIIIVNTSQYKYITQYTQVFNIILIIIATVLYMFITDMSVVTLHSTIQQLVLILELSHTTLLEIVFSHQ